MCKTVISILISALVLIGCSRSEGEQPVTGKMILPKKISDGTIDLNYSYSGNKLATVKRSDGVIVYYTYTGNLVTEIKYVKSNGDIPEVDHFTYDANGNLAEATINERRKMKYSKMSDGRIMEVTTYDDSVLNTRYLTYLNGNLMKTESANNLTTSVYDNKNAILGSIEGLRKIYDRNGATSNNVVEQNISNFQNGNVVSTRKARYILKYNAEGYPIENKIYYTIDGGTESLEKTYTYEYY